MFQEFMTARERAELFEILCHEAAHCRRCPRLVGRRAVLGPANGSLSPKVLFVGEAPGRRGADRTRRPFSGDESGRRFDELLAGAGLTRDEVFITNAVLCCPADDRRNQPPTLPEVRNCRPFLAEALRLIQPPVVATLGAVALRAIGRLCGRPLVLAESAGTIVECDDFLLVPLYHPSPRVLHTVRSLAEQMADFAVLREAIALTTEVTV